MLNQSFSGRNFTHFLTRRDVALFGLGKNSNEYEARLEQVAQNVDSATFKFSTFNEHHFSHGRAVSPRVVEDVFSLRKLNDNVKRVFNVRTADRNRILPQLKVLLAETGEFWVKKLDIRKFFESIEKSSILQMVCDDPRLSFDSKRLLECLFTSESFSKLPGLPRGIALSSTLSEIFMHDFDAKCRSLRSCYFYARYVDDIVLMFHEDPDKGVSDEINKFLPHGLTFNEDKVADLHRPSKGKVLKPNKLTFLGYEFCYTDFDEKRPATLVVGVAEKKIRKTKTRIARALFDYCQNKNFELLRKRITFLTSNFKIGKERVDGSLYAGAYFNNSLIDEARLPDLQAIDDFLRKAIHAKNGSLGSRLAPLLNNTQRRELCRLSIQSGYEKKIVRKFTVGDFSEIKAAWNHG